MADELIRLQRDNESLQGKHNLHVELQQQEAFQMPETVQVSDFTLSLLLFFCVAWFTLARKTPRPMNSGFESQCQLLNMVWGREPPQPCNMQSC